VADAAGAAGVVAPMAEPDYRRLLAGRSAVAMFTRRGEERARRHGLTNAQHHLLLAVHVHVDTLPGVAEAAGHLHLRPHSGAELVERAVAAGYLHRGNHPTDRRRVHLQLTPVGRRGLDVLSRAQLADLADLAGALARPGSF